LLAFFLPSLAVTVRWLHDLDRGGGFVFLGIIPYLGGVILLVLTTLPGAPVRAAHTDISRRIIASAQGAENFAAPCELLWIGLRASFPR